MVYCFDLSGEAIGGLQCDHGWHALCAWLLSLGATKRRYDSYVRLPETIQYLADVHAFVARGFVATPLGAAVQLHLHSAALGVQESIGGMVFVYFVDMLTEAEWRAFEAEERRLATAQVAHAHELPCELAEMIARYVI